MPFEYAFSSLSVDKSPPIAISPFGSINAEFTSGNGVLIWSSQKLDGISITFSDYE